MKQYVGAKSSNAGLSPFFDARASRRRGRTRSSSSSSRAIGVFPYLLSQTTYQAIIQPACDRRQARHVGQGRDDRHRGVQAHELRRQEERRRSSATPPTGVARRRSTASRSRSTGQRADGARAAGRSDRPRDAALAAGGRSRSRTTRSTRTTRCRPRRIARSACAPTRACSRIPACGGPSRSSINRPAAAREGHARRRSGRQRQPVLEGLRVDRPVDQAAHPEPPLAKALLAAAGATNLKFNLTTWNFLDHTDHAASIQAYAKRGRHRRRHRGDGRRQVLRLRARRGGLRDHDAVAEPHGDADGVRRARRAEHLPDAVLHVDG